MKIEALSAALIVLAACSSETDTTTTAPEGDKATPQAPVAEPAPTENEARPKSVKEENELIEFSYGWPADASAIPTLNSRLESELKRDKTEALARAREDREDRGEEFPYHAHYLHKSWETYGSTPRLLTLAADVSTFTGGAHGNTVYDSILWDREADRAIEVATLFGDPSAAFATIGKTYCEGLDRQRANKRQVELPLEGDDWMTECPALAEQVVVPIDSDGNRQFETLRVLLPPYEAGPYAEGSYEVDIPVTDAVRGMIKEEYKAAF